MELKGILCFRQSVTNPPWCHASMTLPPPRISPQQVLLLVLLLAIIQVWAGRQEAGGRKQEGGGMTEEAGERGKISSRVFVVWKRKLAR